MERCLNQADPGFSQAGTHRRAPFRVSITDQQAMPEQQPVIRGVIVRTTWRTNRQQPSSLGRSENQPRSLVCQRHLSGPVATPDHSRSWIEF